MTDKKLTQRKGFWIFVLIAILFSLFITYLSITNIDLKFQRNYYKNQMLNFCELTLMQGDIIFELDPNINLSKFDEPCSYWEIEELLN